MKESLIPKPVDFHRFWELARQFPVIDARSPSEFHQGHLPGAANIPLMNDDQRAVIGAAYHRDGRQSAIDKGFELVGPKLHGIVQATRDQSESPVRLIYCARGGMRSEYYSWLVEVAGMQAYVLLGGYKTIRRIVLEFFESRFPLRVLSGLTGAGKTQLLADLKSHGEQVVDLEGLASHRGSAFGGIGLPPQPSNEQFENCLFDEMSRFDLGRPIWIEDESRRIGRIHLPGSLWSQMQSSPAIFLDVDLEERVEFLMQTYGLMQASELAESIACVKKRLGGDRTREALKAVEGGRIETALRILLAYYDRTYTHSAQRAERHQVWQFSGYHPNASFDVQHLVDFADANESKTSLLEDSA